MASSDCAKMKKSKCLSVPSPDLKGMNSSAKNVLFNKTAEITTGCLQLKIFLISLWFNFEIFQQKDYQRIHTSDPEKLKDLPWRKLSSAITMPVTWYTQSRDRKRVRSFGGLRLTNVIISHQHDIVKRNYDRMLKYLPTGTFTRVLLINFLSE